MAKGTTIFAFSHQDDKVIFEVSRTQCTAFYYSGKEDRFTGHVWLFNVGKTPGSSKNALEDWDRPRPLPKGYCYDHVIQMPIDPSEFDVSFNDSNKTAGIYFRDHLIGILADHWRPGKSSFAKIATPLAKPMDREISRPT